MVNFYGVAYIFTKFIIIFASIQLNQILILWQIKKIILDSASILDASEAKEIRAGELAAILEAGSGSSDRTSSCEGKHYGDSCSFMTDKGYVQSGKCIYNKWGWTPGGLFCALADY